MANEIPMHPRHYTHGLLEAILRAKRERRAYDPSEAASIAFDYAKAEKQAEVAARQ